MITTYLIEHPWLSPLAMVVVLVLGPPAGLLLTTRPRSARVLLALSVVPVVALTLSPSGSPAFPGCEVAWSVPTPGRVELAANVVLLVPPVLLLGVVLRRPLLALLVGSATSALIEVTQSLVTPLGRSCSTDDWSSNTVGAAIGAVVAWAALTWSSRRASRAPRADHDDHDDHDGRVRESRDASPR